MWMFFIARLDSSGPNRKMESKYTKVLLLFLSLVRITTGQTLSETLQQESACYGSSTESQINAECTSHEVIAVNSVKVGSKLVTTGCPSAVSSNFTSPACCEPDVDNDCIITYPITDHHVLCSGRRQCEYPAPRLPIASLCSTSVYIDPTNYMFMDFYCIESSRISAMCDSASITADGSSVYLWNTNYGAAGGYSSTLTAMQTNCTCSIEAERCSTTITISVIDIRFENVNGGCRQYLNVMDADSETHVISCASNNDFQIKEVYTSVSNYVVVSLDNRMEIDGGHFWVAFEASDETDTLTLTCQSGSRVKNCTDVTSIEPTTSSSLTTPSASFTSSRTTEWSKPMTTTRDTTPSSLSNGTSTAITKPSVLTTSAANSTPTTETVSHKTTSLATATLTAGQTKRESKTQANSITPIAAVSEARPTTLPTTIAAVSPTSILSKSASQSIYTTNLNTSTETTTFNTNNTSFQAIIPTTSSVAGSIRPKSITNTAPFKQLTSTLPTVTSDYISSTTSTSQTISDSFDTRKGLSTFSNPKLSPIPSTTSKPSSSATPPTPSTFTTVPSITSSTVVVPVVKLSSTSLKRNFPSSLTSTSTQEAAMSTTMSVKAISPSPTSPVNIYTLAVSQSFSSTPSSDPSTNSIQSRTNTATTSNTIIIPSTSVPSDTHTIASLLSSLPTKPNRTTASLGTTKPTISSALPTASATLPTTTPPANNNVLSKAPTTELQIATQNAKSGPTTSATVPILCAVIGLLLLLNCALFIYFKCSRRKQSVGTVDEKADTDCPPAEESSVAVPFNTGDMSQKVNQETALADHVDVSKKMHTESAPIDKCATIQKMNLETRLTIEPEVATALQLIDSFPSVECPEPKSASHTGLIDIAPPVQSRLPPIYNNSYAAVYDKEVDTVPESHQNKRGKRKRKRRYEADERDKYEGKTAECRVPLEHKIDMLDDNTNCQKDLTSDLSGQRNSDASVNFTQNDMMENVSNVDGQVAADDTKSRKRKRKKKKKLKEVSFLYAESEFNIRDIDNRRSMSAVSGHRNVSSAVSGRRYDFTEYQPDLETGAAYITRKLTIPRK